MRTTGNPGLYWRLLASYLLVILVVCTTLYWVGEAFATFFLDRHLGGMIQQMRHMSPMMEAMSADIDAAYRQASQSTMLWGLAVSALVAGSVGFFVTQRIVAPLRKMQRASRRISAGQYRERLDVQAPGEIGDLAAAFNEMAESLEQTEARRVELLSNVAHELKTPLTSLKGYVAGLRDGLFEANGDTLEACERQLGRLERLIADLSLLSRVETGQEELEPRKLLVSELLEQADATFLPAYSENGVALKVVDPQMRSVIVADPQRTAQVLANLLDNALMHTPSGGEVTVSAEEEHDSVRFEVRDTGEGVREHDLPHLFTRFYRADKARTHVAKQGSGIGLTIAKHYVERQGGQIGASSDVGVGSVFWFTLPLVAGSTTQIPVNDPVRLYPG
ncbi:MAG: HAMP domain-containing sensor histidine kinase [Trueperaceae bacterium]